MIRALAKMNETKNTDKIKKNASNDVASYFFNSDHLKADEQNCIWFNASMKQYYIYLNY